MSYDRYKLFRKNGCVNNAITVTLTPKNTDFFVTYERGKTMLNNVSYEYYGDANYDWLILMANPEYGAMEFEIPDGSRLRIPYPLEDSINDYINKVYNYQKFYDTDEQQ